MFDNPVTRAVAKMEAKIATLDAEAIARLEGIATLEMSEWLALGDMASRAMLAGIVDQGTAQSIHVIHMSFNNDATLAQRLVFLQITQEILGALAAGRG